MVLVVVFMMLFAGCDSSGSSSKQNGFELASFNGGDDALVFDFQEESPPDKIRDQSLQPFTVRLLVENIGEADINESSGYVVLTGFNPEDLGLTESDTSMPLQLLRGYKKQGDNVIPGGKQNVIFSNLKYIPSVVSGTYPFTFYANICYPYKTSAFAMVCINGDTIPAIDEKAQICELEGQKQFANSGAPVGIVNFEQYPYGEHSIQFQFEIEHTPTSDDANIYELGSIDSMCDINGYSASSSEAVFKRDRVTYEVETGIAGLDCEGTGINTNTVTLSNNRYIVTCIQDTLDQAEYEKPVSIVLKYDYLDRISKSINIEHIQI